MGNDLKPLYNNQNMCYTNIVKGGRSVAIRSTHLILDTLSSDMKSHLTMDNPEYHKNANLGFSTKGVPMSLKFWEEKDGKFYLPRNSFPEIPAEDRTKEGTKVDFYSSIIPRDGEQEKGIRALVDTENGVLQGTTGSGKTVQALAAISEVGVTTLILVHKTFLMEQWAERIRQFLHEEPGFVQGEKCDYKGKKLVIGMLQSIYSRDYGEDFYNYFGLVVTDEVHRVPAKTFTEAVVKFPAKRRWGLTATPNRADGLEKSLFLHVGPIVCKLTKLNMKPTVIPVNTDYKVNVAKFRSRFNGNISLAGLVTELSNNENRNHLIIRLLKEAVEKGRKVLVLGERVAQLEGLKDSFDYHYQGKVKTALYLGKTKKEDREYAEQQADVIFGTMQIAKEGLDIPRMDTLFFATPTSAEITVKQSVGRILRIGAGKKDPVVLDLVDSNVSILNSLWNKRVKVYKSLEAIIK